MTLRPQRGRTKRTASDREAATVIGQALREMRLRAGLGYAAMGRAGVPKSTAYKMERGHHAVSFVAVLRYLRACGGSLQQLEYELERYARVKRGAAQVRRGAADGSRGEPLMRVVFLDIDGVLNSARFYRESFDRSADLGFRENHMDASKVALLNDLLERSGAVCVLSSTWRLGPPIGLQITLDSLRARGFTGEIVDCTPDCARQVPTGGIYVGHERGHEIQEWLDAHPDVLSFVILDDSDDMAHLLPRLVRTSWAEGLEQEHVERAIALLAALPHEAGQRGEARG